MSDLVSDLRDLLKKHNCYIIMDADDCSDWHGISGERIVFVDNSTDKELLSVVGDSISTYELPE